MAQQPNIPVPEGNVMSSGVDGLITSNDGDPVHNLYNNRERPAIQSGDWQRRQPVNHSDHLGDTRNKQNQS